MDFFIAILMAWLGAGVMPGGEADAGKHFRATPKESKPFVYTAKRQRPDPGRSYGPIIIIDDTHFKKD